MANPSGELAAATSIMPKQTKPPSRKLFLRVMNSRNTLTVVVKGHQCIESLLNLAISEVLAQPHAIEVKRLPFVLKVDLAVALGVIPSEHRGSYIVLNSTRNRFAHNPTARLSATDVRNMLNSLAAEQRQRLERILRPTHKYRETFIRCVALMFALLEGKVMYLRDKKVRDRAWGAIMEELVGPPGSPEDRERQKYGAEDQERVERLVKEERDRRHAEADL
jgi:hypothetical protein